MRKEQGIPNFPKNEEEVLKFWQDNQVFEKLKAKNKKTGKFDWDNAKIYTTKKTEFVNGGVVAGKAYYYKAKAIAENLVNYFKEI